MRPLMALAIVAGILGGLQLYMQQRPRSSSQAEINELLVTGQFRLEVTLTFDAGPDAFALDAATAPSLLIQLRGLDVLRRTETLSAGEPIVVDQVRGLVAGRNEFFVQASPADSATLVARALRVRLLRDGSPAGEQTLWAEPGDAVQGTLTVDLPAWTVNAASVPLPNASASDE